MRVISWFSCGVSSAVASKFAVEKYGKNVEVVYCNTMMSEHPDNKRFMLDVEQWIGKPITIISSDKYTSVDDVYTKTRYMSGIMGARCTIEMKKVPRFKFQQSDDVHIFGFTVDEQQRIKDFERNNPELFLDWILRDRFIFKSTCFRILKSEGIKLPVMYSLGFKNNNCIGCVKATSPAYWSKVRQYFPKIFDRKARISRALNVRLVRVRVNGKRERIFLDELLYKEYGKVKEELFCGPQCTS